MSLETLTQEKEDSKGFFYHFNDLQRKMEIIGLKILNRSIDHGLGRLPCLRNLFSKTAILSYVNTLPFDWCRFFTFAHNNRYTSFLIKEALQELGYHVSTQNYLAAPSSNLTADLFFGHGPNFAEQVRCLPSGTKKVLLLTGSSPEFGNNAQIKRMHDLYERCHVRINVFKENIVPGLRENLITADIILLMGNNFVKDTWPSEFHSKIHLINNPSAHHVSDRSQEPISRGFVFVSSIGQVHRGLDLVLDAFSTRSDELYVCSLFKEEPEFVSAFHKELFETQNIHSPGFLDFGSKSFHSVLQNSSFCILPSCSEGQSGSIVNCVRMGLIPIVTKNVGLPDFDQIGLVIQDLSTESIHKLLNSIHEWSDAEIRMRRKKLALYAQQFSGAEFKQHLRRILS